MKLIGPTNVRNGELPVRINSNTEINDQSINPDVSVIQKPVRSRSKVNVEPFFGQPNAARPAKLVVLTFGRMKNALINKSNS